MATGNYRGVEEHQEIKGAAAFRDTRTFLQKLIPNFKRKTNLGIYTFMTTFLLMAFPGLLEALLLFAFLPLYLFTRSYKADTPFRMPRHSGGTDHKDLDPHDRPKAASGIFFLGNERFTNRELWGANTDVQTHLLFFGTTGSGKSFSLTSLTINSFNFGSGFIFSDAKGQNTLWSRIYSFTRRFGRIDDLLLVNFMTGGTDFFGPRHVKNSNTLNPFYDSSSGTLKEMSVSLMSDSDGGADMWKDRAIGFVESLMIYMVWLREKRGITLTPRFVRDYFELSKIEELAWDESNVVMMGVIERRKVVEGLRNYLINLPGYSQKRYEANREQADKALEQHGYITMQLTKAFGTLTDTFAHIVDVTAGEVDVFDVISNRRILVVLLPSLEKSEDELRALGKIIVAIVKSVLAPGLGSEVEGTKKDIIDANPTAANTPFLLILDEYGYQAVQGFAVVPAQARSLNVSTIFAGQDYPSFKKGSEIEAEATVANTKFKIGMALEDPESTFKVLEAAAGEAYTTSVESFSSENGASYQDDKRAKIEKRSRIDFLDLKEQNVGQAHFIWSSELIRANVFAAIMNESDEYHVNQFIQIKPPEVSEVIPFIPYKKEYSSFQKILLDIEDNRTGSVDYELENSVKTLSKSLVLDTNNKLLYEDIEPEEKVDVIVPQAKPIKKNSSTGSLLSKMMAKKTEVKKDEKKQEVSRSRKGVIDNRSLEDTRTTDKNLRENEKTSQTEGLKKKRATTGKKLSVSAFQMSEAVRNFTYERTADIGSTDNRIMSAYSSESIIDKVHKIEMLGRGSTVKESIQDSVKKLLDERDYPVFNVEIDNKEEMKEKLKDDIERLAFGD